MFSLMCFLLFFLALAMIISQKGHFFMIILSLEIITLSLYLMCVSSFFIQSGLACTMFMVVFLVISVCEASLGLGLLVNSMRSQGYDYIKGSTVLKF